MNNHFIMSNQLIIVLLIYFLFINDSLKNILFFLILIFLIAFDLFLNKYFFITWIYLIIYASALVILFTYCLMIQFKDISYKEIYQLPIFTLNPIIFIFFIYYQIHLNNVFSYNYIAYNSNYLFNYLLWIKPIFIIGLFQQLFYIFIILTK